MTSDAEYDKLSNEERKIRDTADRAREAVEQAGTDYLDQCSQLFSHACNQPVLPYTWKQELGEVDLIVPVPKGTRGKNLNVVIGKKNLSIGLKGQDNILEGELCKEIKVEESTWTIRESRYHFQLKSSLTVSRGPRSSAHSPREAQQDAVVGKCTHPSP
jgi:hypothetical protein